MKNMIKVIVCAILGMVVLMMVMTIEGRMQRSTEVKSNLAAAVESTVEALKVKKTYNIGNINEYVADVTQGVSMFIDSDSKITVDVMGADTDKGIASIRVTQTFRHPNGNEGSVNCERTVILNRLEEEEPGVYTVRFYKQQGDMIPYKRYTVYEGNQVSIPVAPVMEGAMFAGWASTSGTDITIPVTGDIAFYAIWN